MINIVTLINLGYIVLLLVNNSNNNKTNKISSNKKNTNYSQLDADRKMIKKIDTIELARSRDNEFYATMFLSMADF